MFIACVVVTSVTAALLLLSARLKFVKDPDNVSKLAVAGVAERWLVPLGTLEVLGAAGALVGLVVEPLGLAAGAGLVGYFVVAIAAHLKHHDLRNAGPASLVFVMVAATLVTRVLSL